MLRPPWPTPPMSSNVPQQPAEIASLRAVSIFFEFAPASSSCRDWSRPRATSVSSSGDKSATLLFARPIADAPRAPPQDGFLLTLPNRFPGKCAPAPSPPDRPRYVPRLPYPHARCSPVSRKIRTASAAPYPPDSLCRVSPWPPHHRVPNEKPIHISRPASQRISHLYPNLCRAICD